MSPLTISTALTSWGDGPAPVDTSAVIVLLHGYGSNAADLAGLAPGLPGGFAWASLQAPLPMGNGGFAWAPITTPGNPEPAPVEAAADAVSDWIERMLPAAATVVPLGFSQGGLMASQLLRRSPRRAVAAVVLGGFVLAGELPADAELAASRPPVFSGRGSADGVITADAVARTAAWLPEHSTLTERVYPGLGHGISAEELADVAAFLSSIPA